MPKVKARSLIRFINRAFIAALLAEILVNQKLMSKKEQRPIPSHPKNITIKLSAATRISIKKVKREI